jgi:hypothetical protein
MSSSNGIEEEEKGKDITTIRHLHNLRPLSFLSSLLAVLEMMGSGMG